MSDPTNPSGDSDHGAKFLERDFNQCFSQLRRYESLIWDICKFTFTAYTAVLGVALGLYKYSANQNVDLTEAAIAVLMVGLLVGLSMMYLVIRNRVYYVIVARYINEHRAFFLKDAPLGFSNVSRMYTNPDKPPYFNLTSSQIWVANLIAFLNSSLLAVLVFILVDGGWRWPATIAPALVLLVGQLLFSFLYLRSREGKPASEAVFGRA